VDIAYVGIGANDFYVRDGLGGHMPQKTFALDDPDYQAWEADLVSEIFNAVGTLLVAGDVQILLAYLPPGTADGYGRPELLNAIDHVNSRLEVGCETLRSWSYDIFTMDLFTWQNDSSRYDAEGNLLIGDLVIDHFAYVGDGGPGQDAEKFSIDEVGHLNTAPSGLMANQVLAAMNEHYGTGIPLLTDDEIVAISGYEPVPIPGAIWFLGSGLIGLVGFRRKFKKA
jgi:hypothetical protein